MALYMLPWDLLAAPLGKRMLSSAFVGIISCLLTSIVYTAEQLAKARLVLLAAGFGRHMQTDPVAAAMALAFAMIAHHPT